MMRQLHLNSPHHRHMYVFSTFVTKSNPTTFLHQGEEKVSPLLVLRIAANIRFLTTAWLRGYPPIPDSSRWDTTELLLDNLSDPIDLLNSTATSRDYTGISGPRSHLTDHPRRWKRSRHPELVSQQCSLLQFPPPCQLP